MGRLDHAEENCQLEKKTQEAGGMCEPQRALNAKIWFELPAWLRYQPFLSFLTKRVAVSW
jgi:hypothetical protein